MKLLEEELVKLLDEGQQKIHTQVVKYMVEYWREKRLECEFPQFFVQSYASFWITKVREN
mgnify:CR=1 FL=1